MANQHINDLLLDSGIRMSRYNEGELDYQHVITMSLEKISSERKRRSGANLHRSLMICDLLVRLRARVLASESTEVREVRPAAQLDDERHNLPVTTNNVEQNQYSTAYGHSTGSETPSLSEPGSEWLSSAFETDNLGNNLSSVKQADAAGPELSVSVSSQPAADNYSNSHANFHAPSRSHFDQVNASSEFSCEQLSTSVNSQTESEKAALDSPKQTITVSLLRRDQRKRTYAEIDDSINQIPNEDTDKRCRLVPESTVEADSDSHSDSTSQNGSTVSNCDAVPITIVKEPNPLSYSVNVGKNGYPLPNTSVLLTCSNQSENEQKAEHEPANESETDQSDGSNNLPFVFIMD